MTNNEVNDSSYQDYHVSVSEAQTVALQFMKQLYPARYGQSKVLSVSMQNMEDGLPALYRVDVEPAGWVMVSSDKRYAPVMAYSTEGSISNVKESDIPPVSVFWLEMNLAAQKQTPGDDASNIKQWNELLSNDTAAIIDPDDCVEVDSYVVTSYNGRQQSDGTWTGFLTTEWSQGSNVLSNNFHPYNHFYPRQSTYIPYAGCVPIAVSQVIRFHEHEDIPLSFDWNSMPDISTHSNYGDYEVAKLIWEVARRMYLDFNYNGTGAYLHHWLRRDAQDALRDFGYTSNFRQFQGGVNLSLVEENIHRHLPVILGGFQEDTSDADAMFYGNKGHAWVCDGFMTETVISVIACDYLDGDVTTERVKSESRYYHMNWGWGQRGPYNYPNLRFNGWYISGQIANPIMSDLNFHSNMQIIYNIKPNN